jgi:imidazolonepropionase-like amidohydrolase
MAMPAQGHAQKSTISIQASRVIDGKGHFLKNARVVVQDSKIVAIDHKPDATYDLTGMTLLPGFIDVHDHIYWHFNRKGRLHRPGDGEDPVEAELSAAGEAWKTLKGGFTTIESPGAMQDKDLRDWINAGRIPGPRILTSLQPLTNYHLSADELRHLVQVRYSQGADFIKIFASKSIRDGGAQTMSLKQMKAMCGEARKLGLRTLVHAHADSAVRASVLAGCTEVEHGFFAQKSTLQLMARNGVRFDPQCGLVAHNYLKNWSSYKGIGNYNAAGRAAMKKSIPLMIDKYKRALTIPWLKLAYGTDAVAGAHGHEAEDMICLVKNVGMDPMQVITEVTSNNAKALGLEDKIGTIAPGMQADLVAVPGNPLDDMTVVRHVDFVMKGGHVFKNVPLDANENSRH